jgi:acyl dehydratase
VIDARGPYFEELRVGQVFDRAPAITLSSGLAAVHQSVTGDRLRLPLSEPLARAVTGRGPLAHPALVWDVAIGQSSVVTHNVRANLFYRGLVLHRLPSIGDTLQTVTTIDALTRNRSRDDRPATGLALLRIVTRDQDGTVVLDFHRCAMIPLADPLAASTIRRPLDTAPADLPDDRLAASVAGWTVDGPGGDLPPAGSRIRVLGGDVVSGAPELARLTLNIARVHHDAAAAGGRRLVFGGHTIGLALHQATRALPDLLTVLGWHSCDHLAAVHEGDRLTSELEIERVTPGPTGGRFVRLRSRVRADDPETGTGTEVLDWRFVALHP